MSVSPSGIDSASSVPGAISEPQETTRREEGGGLLALLMVCSVLAGVLVSIAAAPWVFNFFSSDLARIRTLVTALQNPASQPKIVAVGNSVLMNSLDARMLASLLDANPTAYNLGSTGQTLSESWLHVASLPNSVEVVIQFIGVRTLESENRVTEDIYSAFYMAGYRLNSADSEVLSQVYGDDVSQVVNAGTIVQHFRSRWIVRQALDTSIRQLVRKDLDLKRAATDLHYPASYTKKISVRELEKQLQPYAGVRENPGLHPLPEQMEMLRKTSERIQTAGRKHLVVVSPTHPVVLQHMGEAVDELVVDAARHATTFPQGRADVLNLARLVEAEDFVDYIHPSAAGARLVTKAIADKLREPL